MSETVKDAPLTDRELDDLERAGRETLKRYGAELPQDLPETRQTLRFVAEIKRLRSDEWLEKALTEAWKAGIDGRYGPEAMVMGMLPFLRKHRDGA